MPEAPTQGMSQLHAALSALQQATTRLERELVGFEHLAGALLAYAQQQPGFDPVALNDLAQHWMRSGEGHWTIQRLRPLNGLKQFCAAGRIRQFERIAFPQNNGAAFRIRRCFAR